MEIIKNGYLNAKFEPENPNLYSDKGGSITHLIVTQDLSEGSYFIQCDVEGNYENDDTIAINGNFNDEDEENMRIYYNIL